LREEAALLDFDRVRARSSQRDEWIGHVLERGSVSIVEGNLVMNPYPGHSRPVTPACNAGSGHPRGWRTTPWSVCG
jgi:hypothetical protein